LAKLAIVSIYSWFNSIPCIDLIIINIKLFILLLFHYINIIIFVYNYIYWLKKKKMKKKKKKTHNFFNEFGSLNTLSDVILLSFGSNQP